MLLLLSIPVKGSGKQTPGDGVRGWGWRSCCLARSACIANRRRRSSASSLGSPGTTGARGEPAGDGCDFG